MTTHWIIAIGSPKLPVMSGKAILTEVSSGTTEMPSPTSTSRSHGQATTGAAAAALPFTADGIASSRAAHGYRGAPHLHQSQVMRGNLLQRVSRILSYRRRPVSTWGGSRPLPSESGPSQRH